MKKKIEMNGNKITRNYRKEHEYLKINGIKDPSRAYVITYFMRCVYFELFCFSFFVYVISFIHILYAI